MAVEVTAGFRVAAVAQDRVLVLIGGSHVELLHQLLCDSGRVDVVRAGAYLGR